MKALGRYYDIRNMSRNLYDSREMFVVVNGQTTLCSAWASYLEVTLKLSTTSLIRLGLLLSICAACSNGQDDSASGSASHTLDASEYLSPESALNDLFHDEMQFSREDLINGSTSLTPGQSLKYHLRRDSRSSREAARGAVSSDWLTIQYRFHS